MNKNSSRLPTGHSQPGNGKEAMGRSGRGRQWGRGREGEEEGMENEDSHRCSHMILRRCRISSCLGF